LTRVFALLTWHTSLGAAVRPVGVLAVDEAGDTYVSWVPLSYALARTWRQRLKTPTSLKRLRAWQDADGTDQLAELEVSALSVRDAAEAVMDQVLAGIMPWLEP
jgi:hypothetical protein